MSENGATVIRIQVFERKREGRVSPGPWNENEKSKGKETTEFVVGLTAFLQR